ncbi:TonB family protein [Psychrobacter sp. 72-O-c]|uniref:TonB family protein n=1 Tax=Psychrobacter sp. 72-O-c TaxID=2774125 RepID=UPI001D127C3F|nr:TonB family protein [Psychrobacter sp. 72-O-c]
MESPERPEIEVIEPAAIQLELVTLTTSPAKNPHAENPRIAPQSVRQPKPQVKKISAKPVEANSVETVKPEPDLVEPLKPIEPLKPEPKKEQPEPIKVQPEPKEKTKTTVSAQDNITKESEKLAKEMAEEEQDLVALVQAMTGQFDPEPADISGQELVIKESKKTVKATSEEEIDLAAMIRAVTAQYNRDQARQRREATKQENRKRAEQDTLQAQADKGNKKQKQADTSDKPINFATEQASWLPEHEPNTSLPLPVWRETTARSGEVFTVLLELHVDKDGYITEVQLLQSSGNQIIDAVATVQVRAGQLKPLQQNGLPVNGIVPMSLSYERP